MIIPNQFYWLDKTTDIDPKSLAAKILLDNYSSIEAEFDRFLISWNSSNVYLKNLDNSCPSNMEIMSYVVDDICKGPDSRIFLQHRRHCKSCRYKYDAYKFLMQQMWKVLIGQKQVLLVNLLLAHLHKDPPEEIDKFVQVFTVLDEESEIKSSLSTKYLRGMFTLRRIKGEVGEDPGFWYSLVCSPVDKDKVSLFATYPFNYHNPFFRIDWSGPGNQFSIALERGLKTDKEIRFLFGSQDFFSVTASGAFTQFAKAEKDPNWEMLFCGVID